MKIQRTSAYLAAVVLVASLGCAQAAANPLLSGYGGPGQDGQAVLGAALLNGPAGATSPSGVSTSADHAGSALRGEGVSTPSAARRGSEAEGGGSPANSGTPQPPASRRAHSEGQSIAIAPDAASVRAPALGLTGPDLLLTIGVLVALAITWGGTRRTARRRDG